MRHFPKYAAKRLLSDSQSTFPTCQPTISSSHKYPWPPVDYGAGVHPPLPHPDFTRQEPKNGLGILAILLWSWLGMGSDAAATPATDDGSATIGGIVASPKGPPIAGAKITIYAIYKDEVGQFIAREAGTAVADLKGKWSSAAAPATAVSLNFKLSHPEFIPVEYDQVDEPSTGANEVSKADLLAGTARLIMEPGIPVSGQVVDKSGKAIESASITVASGVEFSKHQNLRTDKSGAFRCTVLELGDAYLVVEAKGHAPKFLPFPVSDQLKPMQLVLGKGAELKGRVVDQSHQPVANARLRITSWNERPLLDWNCQTGSDGRFFWDSAPEGVAEYSIECEGYATQKNKALYAGEKEAVIALEQSFLIRGRVLDADTHQPLQEFSITRGNSFSPGARINWQFPFPIKGQDGAFVIRQETGGPILGALFPNIPVILMAEAPGYLPTVSGEYAPKGWHTNDFLLHKGHGPEGILILPDGQPAAGAEVAWVGLAYLTLAKGHITRLPPNLSTKSSATGAFSLPPSIVDQVVAVHEQGYAETTTSELAQNPRLQLQAWGTIEGILKIGQRLGANEQVMLTAPMDAPDLLPMQYDAACYRTTTDQRGRFSITNVPPGIRKLVRYVSLDGRSWFHSHPLVVEVKPGATSHVEFGGQGRTVTAKLTASDSSSSSNLTVRLASLATKAPEPGYTLAKPEDALRYQQSPAMRQYYLNRLQYQAFDRSQNSLRFEDVLPGDYELTINVPQMATLRKEVHIPEGNGSDPVELGLFKLEPADGAIQAGSAPSFTVTSLDGKTIKLADFKGRYLLLVFWMSQVADEYNLKRIHEDFGTDDRLAIVGFNLDLTESQAIAAVKSKDLKWPQAFLGERSKSSLPDRYGVQGLPAAFLVDPQGRLIEKNLQGTAIRNALEKALPRKSGMSPK